ncbi:MAG: cytochrome c [Gammaproteobacteria bacterium]|nr:cytochrome c [Gammaproteobacteria bacterium]
MTLKNITLLSLLSICYLLPQAAADTDVKGTIQYRQNYMNAISGHTGAIRRLKDGRFTAEGHLQMHTEALARLARDIALLFPEGTGTGKTDAKPEIWEDWSDFEARAAESRQAAQALLDAVQSGDAGAIDTRFGELTQTCKACHRPFRK